MKKIMIFMGVFIMVSTANAFEYNIGKAKVVPIVVGNFEHEKSLFIYPDNDKLKALLDEKGSNEANLNVFYVDTGLNKVLFDTGMNADILQTKLKEANINTDDIEYVFITHNHPDHIGGLINQDSSRVFKNAKIFINKKAPTSSDTFQPITKAYGDDFKTFSQEKEIIPHVKSIFAYGHTPEHSAFLVESEGQKILIAGDVVHAPLQFENPNVYMTYDADPIATLQTRKKLLDKASKEQFLVAGEHILQNGIIRLVKNDNGGYKVVYITE